MVSVIPLVLGLRTGMQHPAGDSQKSLAPLLGPLQSRASARSISSSAVHLAAECAGFFTGVRGLNVAT